MSRFKNSGIQGNFASASEELNPEYLLAGKKVFLSASYPEEGIKWPAQYSFQLNPYMVSDSIIAVLELVFSLGGKLVFGGHPTISPIVFGVAEQFVNDGWDREKFIHLYQSKFFKEYYIEEVRWINDNPESTEGRAVSVVETEIPKDALDLSIHEASLVEMWKQMFSNHVIDFAIFIGGKDGIRDEFDLLHQHQPKAKLYPIGKSGGASLGLLGREFADNESEYFNRRSEILKSGVSERLLPVLETSTSFPFLASLIIDDFLGRL